MKIFACALGALLVGAAALPAYAQQSPGPGAAARMAAAGTPADRSNDRQDLNKDRAGMRRDCAEIRADKKDLRGDRGESGYDVKKDKTELHRDRVACGAARNDVSKDRKDLRQDRSAGEPGKDADQSAAPAPPR